MVGENQLSSSLSSASEGLFPTGTAPEIRIPAPSAICSLGFRPLIMTGFFRQLLMQLFVDPEQIDDQSLRAKLERLGGWTNEDSSPILIESITRWRPNTTERRPAVIIKRNDWQWLRLAINDEILGDNISPDGFPRFVGWWKGSHTFFAISDEGAEAEVLGMEVAKILTWYAKVIRDQLGLSRYVMIGIGAVAELEEATENYVVPVTVGYVAREVWTLRQNAPRLKRIKIKTSELLC